MSKSKLKKTKKASSTLRIRWTKHKEARPGDGKIQTSWEAEPIKGIMLFVHYADYYGADKIHYDWNVYVNRPHLITRHIRFGNHYIGKQLTLKAAQLQVTKAFLALFVRILIDKFEEDPESIGWTGTEWKDVP